jgi:glycosyltransferase involved in cell wall biosynthesis
MNLIREARPARLHVFIPAYRNPDLLAETLESLVRAMGPELCEGEVLATCVDDASPEPLESVVRSGGGGWVEYVRNEANLGIIPNFNHCISLARAPLVMFLGADDLVLPSYWPTVAAMNRQFPEAVVYAPGVAEVDSLGRRSCSLSYIIKKAICPLMARFRMVDLNGSHLALRLAIGDFLYFPGLCWRTEDLRRRPFDPAWSDAADWHRLYLCALEGGHVVVDDQTPVFLYRRHARSASEVSAEEGVRFENERTLSLLMCGMSEDKGWWMAAVMAWLHPMVRLNALSRRVVRGGFKKGR